MIARIWNARAEAANTERYRTHLRDAVLPQVRSLPGYQGATLLERQDGGETEITVITLWRSLDDIRAFAGEAIERAVVTDDARGLLASFDSEVRHCRVALQDAPSG
jgi:heme-degrading monooxygenase HmoA